MSSPITYKYERNRPSLSQLPLPDALWNISESPKVLYIQGKPEAMTLLNLLPERGLAVVGTRNPQPRSTSFVREQMSGLADSSLIILSGLARGIDTVVHQAALDARLPTIAVIGSGLDISYPKENETLRHHILTAGGLIVSEYPIGTSPLGYHFLRRNRIIAGWSKATWVIEAGPRSGALNTARWARDQNRMCYAVPNYPGDSALAGNQILLDRDHALAYWGLHSLGATWIELVTHAERQINPQRAQRSAQPSAQPFRIKTRKEIRTEMNPESRPKIQPKVQTDEEHLLQLVRQKTIEQGAVQIPELAHWALEQGWDSQRFYALLKRLITQKQLIHENRFILSS